ncbi:MAG TPA: hypothetical protein VHY09_08720 [Candidatus Methylacidiphilales bacterium]|jgi:hypothetical protein|nr:hypothetical protein [Candidatus Methylacidiphilales bacterium]
MGPPWDNRRESFRALAYVATIAALGLFYAAVSYHSGQSFTWTNGGWYGELARAFLQGQVSLLSQPSPGLLADPHPYASEHPYPFKWDISFYHGKYYAYFGPTPAILFFYPWQVLTGHVLNQALCFWFICMAELILFAFFLAALVRLYFPASTIGMQVLILLVFGVGYAQGFSIHLVTIHNIAQETALLLIMAMFYLIFLALHAGRGQVALVVLAAACWGAAVGSRATLLPYGVVFLPVLYHILKGRPLIQSGGTVLAVMIPPLIVGALLAWYNQARFGNPLDFGIAYQLENRTYTPGPYFSLRYFPMGLTHMLLMPPRPSSDFPFLFPDPPTHAFFNARMGSSKYIGALFALPILLYGFLPLGPLDRPPLRFFRRLLMLSGAIMLAVLSCYCVIYYRYFMDFLTPVFLLMAVGLLAHKPASAPGLGARLLFWGAALWTLYMGVALSLIGEINGLHNFHTYPPPAIGEPWLPDGETTEPPTWLKN